MFRTLTAGIAVIAALAACDAATGYDTGAVVLDVSDRKAFEPASAPTTEFHGAFEALKTDDLGHAEALLDEALKKEPRDPYALLAMGTVMERTGRYYSAVDYYRSAIRYGDTTAGPRLENGAEVAFDTPTSVADVARSNLARLNR